MKRPSPKKGAGGGSVMARFETLRAIGLVMFGIGLVFDSFFPWSYSSSLLLPLLLQPFSLQRTALYTRLSIFENVLVPQGVLSKEA